MDSKQGSLSGLPSADLLILSGSYQMFVAYLLIVLSFGLVCQGNDYRNVSLSYQLCKLKLFQHSDGAVSDWIQFNG